MDDNRPLLDQIDLIPREELAVATGRSVRMLKRDAMLRRGPRPIVLGRKVFYRKSSWRAYISELEREAQS